VPWLTVLQCESCPARIERGVSWDHTDIAQEAARARWREIDTDVRGVRGVRQYCWYCPTCARALDRVSLVADGYCD
jgi:hypothetical protein